MQETSAERLGRIALELEFGSIDAGVRELIRRIGEKLETLVSPDERDAIWRTVGEMRRATRQRFEEASEYARTWLYKPPEDERIRSRDRLIVALLEQLASLVAERLPIVRSLRQGLLRGQRTEQSLSEVIACCYAGAPHRLNAISMVEVAEHGWTLEDALRLADAQEEAHPRPLSIAWVISRAVSQVRAKVAVASEITALLWLMDGEWRSSLEWGNCVVPLPGVVLCLPAGLHPATAFRAYQRRAAFLVEVAHGEPPKRVRAPSEKTLKEAIEVVRLLRQGRTWKEITKTLGKNYPSLAKRDFRRCLQALGCSHDVLSLF